MKRIAILILLVFVINQFVDARYERVFLGTVSWSENTPWVDTARRFNDSYILAKLTEKANQIYSGYPNKSINIIDNQARLEERGSGSNLLFRYVQSATAEVWYEKWIEDPKPVIPESQPKPQAAEPVKLKLDKAIYKAIEKASDGIPSSARIAINRIQVPDNLPKNEIRDIILDFLLDSKYRVVAKEYLETLKNELEEQNSGNYSERKRAETENFSGAGYLLDCKVESSIVRVYFVNVSTGEYAGISKIDYDN